MKESKEKGLIWPRQYFNDVSIVSNEAFPFLPSGVRPLRHSLSLSNSLTKDLTHFPS